MNALPNTPTHEARPGDPGRSLGDSQPPPAQSPSAGDTLAECLHEPCTRAETSAPTILPGDASLLCASAASLGADGGSGAPQVSAKIPAESLSGGDASPRRYTRRARKAGEQRVALVRRIRDYEEAYPGVTLLELARALGSSQATVCRLKHRYAEVPYEELTVERLMPVIPDGTKSPWEFLAAQADVQKELGTLYLATVGASSPYMSKGRRSGSAALALERFADSPLCPPTLAATLRKGSQPKPLLRVIRKITPEVEQLYRGEKHLTLNGSQVRRRELVEILSDGGNRVIAPGDWWVFDDMSTNHPFWFTGPDGDPLIGRQGLYAYDVCRSWIGFELIGTGRDSYTSAIILRFLRRLFTAYGKPRRGVVFELNVWRARTITGHRIIEQGGARALPAAVEMEFERPEMLAAEKALLQDGVRALGIDIHYTYTPRGKEIEGAFNYLQRVFPTFARDVAPLRVQMGHHAGEFEAGAKAVRQVKSGSKHPADLGFMHIDQHAALTEKSMDWINRRKTWNEDDTTRRAELRDALNDSGDVTGSRSSPIRKLTALTEMDTAALMPEKRALMIRDGRVTALVDGQPLDFVSELISRLGSGYHIVIGFDSSDPAAGAAIYNNETSSKNWGGWQIGEFIGWADFAGTVARFDFRARSQRGETDGMNHSRAHNRAVRTAFRAIGIPSARAATARDGRGQVIEANQSATGGRSSATLTSDPVKLSPVRKPLIPQTDPALLRRQADLARQLMEDA